MNDDWLVGLFPTELAHYKCKVIAEIIRKEIIKRIDEMQNPYPEEIFKGKEYKFYRQIYDNAKKDFKDLIESEV